jgi:FKBP-type peptidyl-prolyl cis-trans isomerase FkpA
MLVTPLRRSLTKGLLFCSLLVLAVGCKTYSEEDKGSFDKKIKRFIDKKDWNPQRSESGLYSEQLVEGTGDEPVKFTSEVAIAYKGTLMNGQPFDQTEPGKPLKSQLKGLIMGFREGLLGQKKGGKVRLIVPPQLGYGDMELDKIPQNSVLVFEIEVVDVH